MARIQIIAPKGTTFTIGGKRITDSKPITARSEEYRIMKYLSDGSVLLYEEPKKPKKALAPKVKDETPKASKKASETEDKPKTDGSIEVDELLDSLPEASGADKEEASDVALTTEE